MKDRSFFLRAFWGTVALALAGTIGCTTAKQAPGADKLHTSTPEAAEAAKACRMNLRSIDGAKRVWGLRASAKKLGSAD